MTRADQSEPLSPLELLSDKTILLAGSTGFLAKIMLAMLLERFSVKKIYCLVRATRSKTAEDRLYNEVLASEAFDPIKKSFGDSFEALIHQQVVPISGDITKPNMGIDEALLPTLRKDLDLVINSAGLVNFNPPLDSALEINAIGALEVAKFVASLDRPRLVHISTCFVVGERSGRIREDSDLLGYFPNEKDFPGVSFDWQREIKDLQRSIQQVKDRTDDAALESSFRKEALERLKKEGREAHQRTVRAAITNQRRRWVTEELIKLGKARAKHWGWPNIYTFSKALGEQAIAATEGLEWVIVRPAIVESSVAYPFPGWNEGMNTSAPLAYLGIHGHVVYPGSTDLILDLIPVDYVSSATLAASAALLRGEKSKVYQAASGDVNPCSMARVVTLVGLYKRRYLKRKEELGELPAWKAAIQTRTESIPVSKKTYERLSAPRIKRLVSGARSVLDELEPERMGPFGRMVSRARKVTRDVESDLGKVTDAFDLFMPFIWEYKYVFRTQQTRELFYRMNEADRALLPFNTEGLDWRDYWLEIHLPGLEKWVFPKLDPVGPKRVPIPRDYRDLAEMFQSRTAEHSRRVAFRVLRKDDVADSFTYRDVNKAAHAVSCFLQDKELGRGDRIAVLSEGRPEWGMAYFGIILSGATAIPIDVDLSAEEITNILNAAKAKGVILSPKQREKLEALNGESAPIAAELWSFDTVFESAHTLELETLKPIKRKPEDVASIIFTSGTTGRPKGVVLTDRNFTGLTARMSALFELTRSDALLSVLPPHHTFEFSVGLLMPIASGASITYLEDRTPELISRAFEEMPVTAMIGVPAVWESLHRKVANELKENRLVEFVVRMFMRANRMIRDRTTWNPGRWVLRPIHNAFGGRIRYMVSGGAPLKPAVFKDLRGMGFSIYEGYGMTEASPVLTVGWPRMRSLPGSVGWALPGVEVRISTPDDSGVGEVIARGPTIMQGYLDNPEATQDAIRGGWLHTGDRGRLDDDGRLFLVGREKDVIIDTSGKNVYPDEIEELYSDSGLIKQMSVVGIPAEEGTGERVAALVVPDYEASEVTEQELSKEQVKEKIRAHFREVGSKLPFARRVKIMHLWESELPETSTRKIKRPFVREQLIRLERALQNARSKGTDAGHDHPSRRVHRTIASIAQKSVGEIRAGAKLVDDLGFDSLMQLELLTAMEAEFPKAHITQEEMNTVETVDHIVRMASRDRSEAKRHEEVGNQEEEPLKVPGFVADMGKSLLGRAQQLTYEQALQVEVEGRGNIPANRNFIVASNHSSHLDMGLVKYALGEFGRDLATLAAKDYFFDDPLRRTYFENFTNLLPMDRHGSLKKSLRMASEAIRNGRSMLIFPEGTRARDGVMINFKPAIGHLCLNEQVDILPLYLGGTHDALPVGSFMPKNRKLEVKIGAPVRAEDMLKETKGMARSKAYRYVALQVEASVRKMGNLPPPDAPKTEPVEQAKQPTQD